MAERIYPNVKVKMYSNDCYSPRGAKIKLIVIHDTEGHNRPGVSDLVTLGDIFQDPKRYAACHVGVDAEGQSGRYVRDVDAAYQVCDYNRVALGIENIGFASQTSWPDKQIKEAARWVGLWSVLHGVPIRRARTYNGAVLRTGVTTHAKLGGPGCNHSDPGPNYPMGQLLTLAQHYKQLIKENA